MKRNFLLFIQVMLLGAGMGFAQVTSAPLKPAKVNSAAKPATFTAGGFAGTAQAGAAIVTTARGAHMMRAAAAALAMVQSSPCSDREAVLTRMNQTAASFKAAQADFDFETYQKLMDDRDHQSGRIYFRRTKKSVDAAFDVAGRAPKQVLYKDGKLSVYEKKIEQVTEREVGANKSDVEAFLSLGFGARGDDLLRDFEVTMGGCETVDGVKTARLELVPKGEKLRQTYNKILLWIDPERDVLLQQQFFEPSGDYRLARYTNMKLSGNLPDDVFRLKTSGSTKTIKSQ